MFSFEFAFAFVPEFCVCLCVIRHDQLEQKIHYLTSKQTNDWMTIVRRVRFLKATKNALV